MIIEVGKKYWAERFRGEPEIARVLAISNDESVIIVGVGSWPQRHVTLKPEGFICEYPTGINSFTRAKKP